MRKVFMLLLLLFCLPYKTYSKVIVIVENSPSEGLQSYLQGEADRDSSTFNGGLAVFDRDTIRISFQINGGTRFINVVFHSAYVIFNEVPVPTLAGYSWLFRDAKLYKLVNHIYTYSYHSDKNMAYYLDAVYFCHCLDGGKKIRGVYTCSFDEGYTHLFIESLSYLRNYSEPEYKTIRTTEKSRRKGKIKKEVVFVPREWKDAFAEYGNDSYVFVKEDQNFYDYIEDINK